MKSIGIITIHFGTNHGSVLQSYALSNYLDSLGYDARIIDYVPARYSIWNNLILKKRSKYPFPILLAYYPFALLRSFRVRTTFRLFVKRNLKLTSHYSNKEDLKKSPPKADVYISGSDQVWNNDYNGNYDFSYFLDFIPSNVKKMAYAGSFGKSTLESNEYKSAIKPLLESFDSVSVRESDAQDILNELQIPSTHVVDPVFLLSKEQWKKFGNTYEYKKPYTLVYVMDGIYTELLDYAEKVKKLTENDIYVVSFKKIKDERIDKCFYLSDPKAFVGLISGADTVVTNSFHGTAFSVLFQKKFITIGKERYNSRMTSLLGNLSLMNHFVPTGKKIEPQTIVDLSQRNNDVDADTKLQQWILKSKEFIDNSLNF